MATVGFTVPDDTVFVADGGLATELEARGADLSDPLWSARLLIDAPEDIAAVHAAFFAAGADIATTAGYQASFDGFAARGTDRGGTTRLLNRSVRLARAAAAGRPGRWVAASVGPYGAARADGSEYVGRYGLSTAQLAAWHRPRLEVLAAGDADVLACETVPDLDEAEALVGLIRQSDTPAWLSYTIEGAATRAGQPLAEAFAVAAGVPQIVAVGVNCCAPDDVLPAIEIARAVTAKPVIVYPNSGERWTADGWAGPRRFSPDLVPAWVAAGARIIGGCCRVTPADIAGVANAVRRACIPGENPAGSSP
ncbi:homocysteine S-methyltransferase [Mycolicibacter minnesotensis]